MKLRGIRFETNIEGPSVRTRISYTYLWGVIVIRSLSVDLDSFWLASAN